MSDSIKASLGRRIKTLRRENGLFLSPVRLNRCRTCDFYASGTSPFKALATLRAAAVIVRSSTFTVTSAYFS